MTIKRGYLVGGGTLGLLMGMLLIKTGNAFAPSSASLARASFDGHVLNAAITKDTPADDGNNPTGTSSASTTIDSSSPSKIADLSAEFKAASPNSLIWEQDFSKLSSIDQSFWNIATPALPIYNNEAQKYYNQPSNVRIENSALVLEAQKQPDGSHASGRVDTKGKKAVELGSRLEARLKLPSGKGTWPAFWMLSGNNPYTSALNPTDADWQKPRFYLWDGEIDIMEAYGTYPGVVEATAHTYARSSSGSILKSDASTSFHTYWLEWRTDKLVFGVDDKTIFTKNKTSGTTAEWPFNAENKFYIILNLAMGGNGGGNIIQSSGDNWRLEIASVKYFKLAP